MCVDFYFCQLRSAIAGLIEHRLWAPCITRFVPPQIRTRHAALPGIRAGSPNKNISQCLRVSLRTVQKIRKELGESNGDYEGAAARETHSARSENNSRIRWWDQDRDWRRSLVVNDGYSQGHECVCVSYQADSALKHSFRDTQRANRTLHHVTQAGEPAQCCQRVTGCQEVC